MFNDHKWTGDEIIINNDLEKDIVVEIYHGDKFLGTVNNDIALTNVRAQIKQKFYDETNGGKENIDNWVDYYAKWNGNTVVLSRFGGYNSKKYPYTEIDSCLNIIIGL